MSWQLISATINTAPKDVECFFWLDWADDCAGLNPPMNPKNMDRLFRGKFKCWPSIYKAKYWMPLPAPPPPDEPETK